MKLVFIHGSGMNREVWQHQLEYFGNAEALDLPGHPSGQVANSIDEYLDYLNLFLEQQSEDVVLVGHSLGGAIALKLAISKPDKLAAIILVGAGARLKVMPMILDELSKCAANNSAIPDIMFAMNNEIDEPLRLRINQAMAENGAAVMLSDLRICDQFDVMVELAKISVPTLALVGDNDQMTPPKYTEYMVNEIPGAEMAVINGGTHMAFAEKPKSTNVLISEFLEALS